MANPRQRRKARSSSHKPNTLSRRAKRNLKKTPPIRGPKVLQDAWDKKKTVRQNYAALGLVHTLNPTTSGGTEPPESTTVVAGERAKQNSHASDPDTSAVIPKGFGRIVRDEAGNVMQIELAEEEESDYLADENLGMMKGPEIIPEAIKKWVTRLGKPSDTEYQLENGDTIGTLEGLSVVQKGIKRHASSGEMKYLQRLVDKYGCDVEGMARDRKLNIEQHAFGELQRGLRKTGLLPGREEDREDHP